MVSFQIQVSESKVRSKRDSEIVMSSILEIHLIANIRSPAKNPPIRFQTTAWVKHAVHVAGPQSAQAAPDGRGARRRGIETKVHDTALDGSEKAHWTAAGLDFGTEQRVQNAQT